MGALLTKSAQPKNKVDVSPTKSTLTAIPNSTNNELLDPRSPNPFRTPISDLQYNEVKALSKAQDLTNNDNISTSTTTTPTKLKTKLLRDLGYTLDPRSPALNFDRTPLVIDLDMTDDFSLAGLSLNESDAQTPIKEKDIENFYTPVVEIVKRPGAEIDPRSPSIDIERTPLNLNNLADESQEIQKDINSQSDVVAVDVYTPTIETTDAAVITETVKNMIYMDDNEDLPITPKKSDNLDKMETKRTPLSCLINTQGADNRMERRMKVQNKSNLARSIFKDSVPTGNVHSGKMPNSSSKIPVFRRSCSKDSN